MIRHFSRLFLLSGIALIPLACSDDGSPPGPTTATAGKAGEAGADGDNGGSASTAGSAGSAGSKGNGVAGSAAGKGGTGGSDVGAGGSAAGMQSGGSVGMEAAGAGGGGAQEPGGAAGMQSGGGVGMEAAGAAGMPSGGAPAAGGDAGLAGAGGAASPACDLGYVDSGSGGCIIAPDTVSIRWTDSTALAAEDVAGFTPVANWNNGLGDGPGQGDNGTKSALKNRVGLATGVGVTWASQDVELTTITGGTAGDQKLMAEGIRSWQGHGDASLTFTGLAASFPTGYRLLVHVGRGGGYPTNHTASFSLTVGTDAAITGKVMPVFDGTWDSLAGSGDSGNYYLSATQSADTATVTLAATGGATLPTAAINGIEIIVAP